MRDARRTTPPAAPSPLSSPRRWPIIRRASLEDAMAGNVAVQAQPAARTWLARFRPQQRTELVGYLFILPYLIAFVLFMVVPTVWGFYISLTSWGGLSAPRFVGLNNYLEALRADAFWQSVRNTVYYTVLLVPALTVIGLAAAVFVNQRLAGFALARVFFYSPYVMAVTVTGLLWMWILDKNVGVLNYYLGLLIPYFRTEKIGWLITAEWAMPSIVLTTIWWLVGYQMVILLAGLQDIPHELYEAARIDGANSWQSFWSITLPLLQPTLAFVIITNVIGSLRVFGQMFLMTQGGPAGATTSVVLYIYQSGFQAFRFGYSAAVSFLLFLGILAITLIQLRIERARALY
jgi:multiple sugar transport system permease protein